MVLLDKQIKTKDLLPKMETRTPSDARIYIFSIFENKETLKEISYLGGMTVLRCHIIE